MPPLHLASGTPGEHPGGGAAGLRAAPGSLGQPHPRPAPREAAQGAWQPFLQLALGRGWGLSSAVDSVLPGAPGKAEWGTKCQSPLPDKRKQLLLGRTLVSFSKIHRTIQGFIFHLMGL